MSDLNDPGITSKLMQLGWKDYTMQDGPLPIAQPTHNPIGTIIFPNVGALEPTTDITPMEATRIAIMLALATTNSGKFFTWDFQAYITQHNLERHFLPLPDATQEVKP
jgi:hypothetical protein